jgi:hypothetical protein
VAALTGSGFGMCSGFVAFSAGDLFSPVDDDASFVFVDEPTPPSFEAEGLAESFPSLLWRRPISCSSF